MMSGMVLGDLWGIEEGVWVQLWSGVLGAVVSAGVAALVAVLVLTRSNKVQRKLAAEALDHQKVQGEKQLAEQRAEAARARELDALADVIFAAEGLALAALDSEEKVRGHVPVLQSAMARWRIELGRSPMQQEIMKWSILLLKSAYEEVKAAAVEGHSEALEEVKKRLSDAVSQLTAVALMWPTADANARDKLLAHMEKKRLELSRPFPEAGGSST